MATQVVMPQMGYDMTEGTVVKWIKNEGDAVKKGDVIAEIETDKATVEMEADAAGVLRRIVVGPGNKVPVGEVIAYIGSAD
ncbi:MAG: biotin/lipoyl-binding protein, partial [SAR202 cluster bacterium]|nr:biotin/lipoyl-binding protein [SAR202 cluster bacterium]